MKAVLVFLLVVVAAIASVPFIPLSAAIEAAHLEKFGFEASDIQGNLLSGQIYDAHFGKVALGDITSSLSFADLSKGRVKLQVQGTDEVSKLSGAFSYGLGGLALEKFNMGVPAMIGAPPLGGLTINITDLDVRFPGGVCTDGTGTARAWIAGAAPGLGIPNTISGPVVCRDGYLVLDLMSDSGREREVITVLDYDRYRVRMTVQQTLPQITRALEAKGFVPSAEGYVLETERSL